MTADFNDRQIRIFLSSTFADMQAERDYLVKNTFPSLKTECQRRNVDFSVVDLRWGITEEESKSGKVIEICIDEINRTRPFFIGLLGGRYGWIPDEKECHGNARLSDKYPWIQGYIDRQSSITEIEMEYGALSSESPIYAQFFVRHDEAIPQRFRETEQLKIDKLHRLKQKIEQASAEGRCTMDRYSTPSELGRMIHDSMMKVINELYPEGESHSLYDTIYARQQAIEGRMRKVYVPVADSRLYYSCPESLDKKFLVLGEHGIGKTALLANWKTYHHNANMVNGIFIHREGHEYQYDDTDYDNGPGKLFVPIIRMFAGNELNTFELCKRLLLYRLARIYDAFPADEVATSIAPASQEPINLHAEFSKYGFNERIIVIIDGFDRLADAQEAYLQLATAFPANVSLIVSSADEKLAQISSKFDVIRLESLSSSDVVTFVEAYLKEYAKRLTDAQRMHIAGSTLLRNPSLLVLMLEELLQFGIFERLDEYIDNFLRATTPEEFVDIVLNRLDTDFQNASHLFSLLALCRIGIPESELVRMLDVNPVEWASLYGASLPMLNNIGGYLQLRSETIRNAALARYVTNKKLERSLRKEIVESLKRSNRWIKKKIDEADVAEDGLIATMIKKAFSSTIPIGEDSPLGIVFRQNIGEMMRQYDAMDNYRALNRLMKSPYTLISNNLFEIYQYFPKLYAAGYHPISNWYTGFKTLKLYLMVHIASDSAEEEVELFNYMTTSMLSFLICLDPEYRDRESKRIHRRLSRMWLVPRRIRNASIELFDQTLNLIDNGVDYMNNNIEDTWIPGKPYNMMAASLLANEIETMLSEKRIAHIQERAMAMLTDENSDKSDKAVFVIITAMCMARLRKFDQAQQLLDNTEVLHGTELLLLRINIIIRLMKHNTSDETLKQIEKLKSYFIGSNATFMIRLIYEQYLLTYKLQRHDISYLDQALANMEEILASRENDERGNIISAMARWFKIVGFDTVAAKMYIAAAKAYDNIADKAFMLELAAECLYKTYHHDYATASSLYAQAAELYHEAGNTSAWIKCHYRSALALYYNKEYASVIERCREASDDNTIKESNMLTNFLNIEAMAYQAAITDNCGIEPAEAMAQAMALYQRTIEIEPEDSALVANLLSLITDNLELASDEQIAMALKYCDEHPDLAIIHYTRYRIFTLQNRFDEAIDEALELQENPLDNRSVSKVTISVMCMYSNQPKRRIEGIKNVLSEFNYELNITKSHEDIMQLIGNIVPIFKSKAMSEYIDTISPADNIDVLLALFCAAEHEEVHEDADAGYEFITEYIAAHAIADEDAGFDFAKEAVRLTYLRKMFAGESITASSLLTSTIHLLNDAINGYYKIAAPINCIADACDHTDSSIVKESDEVIAEAAAKATEAYLARFDDTAEAFVGIVDALQEINSNISVIMIEHLAPYIAKYGDAIYSQLDSDEGKEVTVAQSITQYLFYQSSEYPSKYIASIYRKCGLTPLEKPVHEDYATPEVVLRKIEAFRNSCLGEEDIESIIWDAANDMADYPQFEMAITICDYYYDIAAANDYEQQQMWALILKAYCLAMLGRTDEATALGCEIREKFSDAMYERDFITTALTLVVGGKVIEALEIVDAGIETIGRGGKYNSYLFDFDVIRAIAYAKQGLMADAECIFGQAMQDKVGMDEFDMLIDDSEDVIESKAENSWKKCELYIALYHIAVAAYHTAHNNLEKAVAAANEALTLIKPWPVPLCHVEYAKVAKALADKGATIATTECPPPPQP
ncbi:MAG: DUF4062 domain-containing protein [Muribaculaceae bacterium]